MPGVEASSCSFSRLMSVAVTAAPSRAKAKRVARPIPWAAAVTSAVLPCSLAAHRPPEACYAIAPMCFPAHGYMPASRNIVGAQLNLAGRTGIEA